MVRHRVDVNAGSRETWPTHLTVRGKPLALLRLVVSKRGNSAVRTITWLSRSCASALVRFIKLREKPPPRPGRANRTSLPAWLANGRRQAGIGGRELHSGNLKTCKWFFREALPGLPCPRTSARYHQARVFRPATLPARITIHEVGAIMRTPSEYVCHKDRAW